MAEKFKVGDQVVGNALADTHYNLTVRGWRGEVVAVAPFDDKVRLVIYGSIDDCDDIAVRGVGRDNATRTYAVRSECFDLVNGTPDAPQFKRILRSGDRFIVIWQDGTKTIVRRSPDEPDSNYAAFTAALAIKLYGSNSRVKRILETNLEYQAPKKPKQKEPEQKPMRFKVGDLVRTRKDLIFGREYSGYDFIDGMQIDKGKILTADPEDNTYRLDNNFWYSEEMLEAVDEGAKE